MKTKFILLIVISLCLITPMNAQGKLMESLMGKNKVDHSEIPDSYNFEWEFKMKMTSGNDDSMDMNYLISPDNDFIGMQMSSKEYKDMDFMCMVMDIKLNLMITFMSSRGQNMAMQSNLKQANSKKEKEPKYSYKEIGTKEILGYTCYGIELENADYIGTIYFTLDAPVNFSAFFAFANNKNGPKGFDPALLKVLQEEALLMEMDFANKKKKKQSFTMTAISLEEKKTTISKKEYQFMKAGF